MAVEDKIVGSQQSAVSSGQARKRVSAAVYIENLMGGSEKGCAFEVFFYLLLVDKIVNIAVCVKSSFIRILLGNVLCKIL